MRREGWITFSVFALVVMAAWTLVIKYLAPVLWTLSEQAAGRPAGPAPIMWDFWWVAHLGLAWLLWHRHRQAWAAGMTIAAVEVAIVVTKFVFWFQQPDLSFWRLLWFTNKVYVLAFFLFLLARLARRDARDALEASPPWRRTSTNPTSPARASDRMH